MPMGMLSKSHDLPLSCAASDKESHDVILRRGLRSPLAAGFRLSQNGSMWTVVKASLAPRSQTCLPAP